MTISDDFTTIFSSILSTSLVSNIVTGLDANTVAATTSTGYFHTRMYSLVMELFSSGKRFLSEFLFMNEPLEGSFTGDVYTPSFETMTLNSRCVMFILMPTYTGVVFCDENFEYLGHLVSSTDLSGVLLPKIISNGVWV